MSYFLVRWIQDRLNDKYKETPKYRFEEKYYPLESWMCSICKKGYCSDIDGHLALENKNEKTTPFKCSSDNCDRIIHIFNKNLRAYYARDKKYNECDLCASCPIRYYESTTRNTDQAQ